MHNRHLRHGPIVVFIAKSLRNPLFFNRIVKKFCRLKANDLIRIPINIAVA